MTISLIILIWLIKDFQQHLLVLCANNLQKTGATLFGHARICNKFRDGWVLLQPHQWIPQIIKNGQQIHLSLWIRKLNSYQLSLIGHYGIDETSQYTMVLKIPFKNWWVSYMATTKRSTLSTLSCHLAYQESMRCGDLLSQTL